MGKRGRSKKKNTRLPEVAMWIDRYGDLFSDFDPRPYSQKRLSFDFLVELKRATKDQYGAVNLNLLIPKDKRRLKDEKDIETRLNDYFIKHSNHIQQKNKNILKNGLLFCSAGTILMFIASFLLFFEARTFILNFLIVLMEPGGWFLFWQGLDLAIFESRKEKPDFEFYNKLSKSRISFSSY